MNELSLAIIGCGGMGHRHLRGLAELRHAGYADFALLGCCDLRADNAHSLAAEAEKLLAYRPTPTSTLDELARACSHLDAVDICTEPASHHTLAIEALQRRWHVQVEKPLGLTVRACHLICNAARCADRVLSVAENYRRDPLARLARALLQDGAIGEPRLFLQAHVGGADRLFITPWRHDKLASGLLVDVGVHYADLMEYLLGPVDWVCAQARLHEPVRYAPRSQGLAGDLYSRWRSAFPPEVPATAEDAAYAILGFAGGATGLYVDDHAGHGQGVRQRLVFGSLASLELPGDRSGRPITLCPGIQERVTDEAVLNYAPSYRLGPLEARLFGSERVWRYDLEFPETDRKLIAIEYHDFAQAALTGREPEVGPEQGRRATALAYALLESSLARRAVTVAEVEADALNVYQQPINDSLGLG